MSDVKGRHFRGQGKFVLIVGVESRGSSTR